MRKRFTLLEMVVAMLIVGVLLSLSLTGLEKLATAEAMKTAAMRLENAVLKARTKAIIEGRENNVYVALLLPDSNDFISAGGLPCRSYRICTVEKNGTGYEFKGWLQNEDWQTLGTGIVIAGASDKQRENRKAADDIDEDNGFKIEDKSPGKKLKGVSKLSKANFYDYMDGKYGDTVNPGDTSAVDDLKCIKDVKLEGPGAATHECPGIVFNKYGNIVNAVDLCLVLAEGNVLDVGSTDNSYRFRNVFTDTKNGDLYLGNWVEITFNIFNGRPNIRMMGEDKP